MRILIVKTSSMGDVIHALPIVSDICNGRPGTVVHWAVEEAFAPIVAMHPQVARVIPVALRRWRRQLGRAATWVQLRALRTALRAESYDHVIDCQGLLKSAVLARMARGPITGFDRLSAREPLASFAYQQPVHVAPELHAVERNRRLAAAAVGHPLLGPPLFGLMALPRPRPDVTALLAGKPYAALLTNASRATKLWPDERWAALGHALMRRGLRVLLFAGDAVERAATARRVAMLVDKAPGHVAPVDEATVDPAPLELAAVDAEPGDAALADAAAGDARPADAGPGDAAPGDAALADATPGDAAAADTGPGDATFADAGPGDAAPAEAAPDALLAPQLPLDAVAALLAGARVAVGLDTGLSHLAAALGVPTVGIFCDYDPRRVGLVGDAHCISLGGVGQQPAVAAVVAAVNLVLAPRINAEAEGEVTVAGTGTMADLPGRRVRPRIEPAADPDATQLIEVASPHEVAPTPSRAGDVIVMLPPEPAS